MANRNLVLFQGLCLITLGGIFGCSATDPGEIPIRRPAKIGQAKLDGGFVNPLLDGGGSSGPIFTTAYVPGQTGPTTNQSAHQMRPEIGQLNPAGKDCIMCHNPTGVSGMLGKIWTAGGTVYTTSAGTQAAGAGVEVRLANVSVYTDANGNFFFPQALLPTVPVGALVGVRDATNTKLMVGSATGSCQSAVCHAGSPTVRIYLQ